MYDKVKINGRVLLSESISSDLNMLLIWNQLHLKEKAFKPQSCKNELDHNYSLDVRGGRKGSLV